jgi:hypothetical protein
MVSKREARQLLKKSNPERSHSGNAISTFATLSDKILFLFAKKVESEVDSVDGRGSRVTSEHVTNAALHMMSIIAELEEY